MINNIIFQQPLQILPKQTTAPGKTGLSATSNSNSSFAKMLDEKLPGQEVKFSQHAQDRLKARGITLTDDDKKKLSGAVENVAKKGGKESLIMMGDAAYVVSVKNRTVITAMDRGNLNGNIFTNIDSAAVV